MKRILTASLIAATLAGPAAAFSGGFPFQIFDIQFPEDGAFDKDKGERARVTK